MGRKTTFIALVLVFLSLAAFPQQKDSVTARLNHYSLTFGTGWTHYIDNLEYGVDKIRKDFAGVSLKFFWEPEHRLSLGLETGYYRMFRVTSQYNADTAIQVDRDVVPLLLLVRMRIVDHVYLGAGMGLAMIFSKASGAGQEVNTKVWSLSNYQFSGSYIYPLTSHWQVGGELKMFNFGKLDDWIYSVQALCAFRL
jgi:opacity protein-like surface antigen